MWSIFVGTRDSSRAQLARRAGPSVGRSFELQRNEMSENVPLVRIIAPSDPWKIWVGFDGLTAITCSSGWIEFGAQRHRKGSATGACAAPRAHHVADGSFCASKVRSVNVRFTAPPVAVASGSPAVVE